MVHKTPYQSSYTRLPTAQCIAYIQSHGLTMDDYDTSLRIPSGYGHVFSLPTKQIVLIPTSISMPYEGFIFETVADFERILKSEFFPVSDEYLTYWEAERDNLKDLPNSVGYFELLLKKELRIPEIERNPQGFQRLYELIVKYIEPKTNVTLLKRRVLLAYAITVMDYLVNNKGGRWMFNKKYVIYNSYNFPFVEVDGQLKIVTSILFSSLRSKKGDYRNFKSRVGL